MNQINTHYFFFTFLKNISKNLFGLFIKTIKSPRNSKEATVLIITTNNLNIKMLI